MALVVENGAGLPNADSYASVAETSTYLTSVAISGASNVFTAAVVATQEVALRQATRFLDARFALRFSGERLLATQSLQWPRANAVFADGHTVDDDIVPVLIKNAAAELALRVIADTTGHDTSRLMPDQTTPGSIKSKRVRADTVERDIEYIGGAAQQKLFAIAEAMLATILTPGGRLVLA